MLVNRLIDSHFTSSLIFTALVLMTIIPSLGWLDTNNAQSFEALLLLICLVPFAGILLNERVWMLSPLTGFTVTLLSAFYSISTSTITNSGLCVSTTTNRGYPYQWNHQAVLSGSCRVLYYFTPSPLRIGFFILDIAFYMTLSLACLELYRGLRGKWSQMSLQDSVENKQSKLGTQNTSQL